MGLFKNAFEMLSEATKVDSSIADDIEGDIDWSCVKDAFNNMETIEEGVFVYDATIVPVVEATINDKTMFLVEAEALASYMKIAGITDVKEAIKDIADANDEIEEPEDLSVVVDEKDTETITDPNADMEDMQESCKGKKKVSKKTKDAAKLIKELKDKDIKVLKKKGHK